MLLETVSADATTGASIASREPVRVVKVEMMRFGFESSVRFLSSVLTVHGHCPSSLPEELPDEAEDFESLESLELQATTPKPRVNAALSELELPPTPHSSMPSSASPRPNPRCALPRSPHSS